jgi:RNA polymerase sigma-70 factor (ECF subfamily)
VSALLGVPRHRAASARDLTLTLYARHGQRVYSFCLSRLRKTEEAQDAAQTTFLNALNAFRRGVVPHNELAWLLTIADNVCRSTRRTNVRRAAHLVDANVDEVQAAASSLSAETLEEVQGLCIALEELTDNQRRAILLREWQGLSYADIAVELGLSVGAVETLLFRARRRLATLLESSRRGRRRVGGGSGDAGPVWISSPPTWPEEAKTCAS